MPAAAVSGRRYPILSTCDTNDIDISRFVLTAADPGAWRIAQSSGRVYLTDDVGLAPAFDFEWTGAVSGNWSEPGNWNDRTVPNTKDMRVAHADACVPFGFDLAESFLRILDKGVTAKYA